MADSGSHIYSSSYETGDIIFREGDAGDSAYIVESGAVEISMIQNGQRTVLSRIGEGGLFGEMAVIDDQPRTATVVALETNLVSISRPNHEHLNQGDSVVNLLLKVILTRYRSNLERSNQPGKVVAPAMQPDLTQSGVQLESAMSKPAEAAIEAIRLEADLKNGIDRGEFVCFYQPIVDLETRVTAGFEALVRWEHPKRGLLSPYHFIDLAEKTGLIIPLGDYVLERACKDLPELERACNDGNTGGGRMKRPFVSVNVSGRQLGVLATSTPFEKPCKPRKPRPTNSSLRSPKACSWIILRSRWNGLLNARKWESPLPWMTSEPGFPLWVTFINSPSTISKSTGAS